MSGKTSKSSEHTEKPSHQENYYSMKSTFHRDNNNKKKQLQKVEMMKMKSFYFGGLDFRVYLHGSIMF